MWLQVYVKRLEAGAFIILLPHVDETIRDDHLRCLAAVVATLSVEKRQTLSHGRCRQVQHFDELFVKRARRFSGWQRREEYDHAYHATYHNQMSHFSFVCVCCASWQIYIVTLALYRAMSSSASSSSSSSSSSMQFPNVRRASLCVYTVCTLNKHFYSASMSTTAYLVNYWCISAKHDNSN